MDVKKLTDDLGTMMAANGIPNAIFVIPLDPAGAEFSIFTVNTSSEHLRQLGHRLIKAIPDERGPLS